MKNKMVNGVEILQLNEYKTTTWENTVPDKSDASDLFYYMPFYHVLLNSIGEHNKIRAFIEEIYGESLTTTSIGNYRVWLFKFKNRKYCLYCGREDSFIEHDKAASWHERSEFYKLFSTHISNMAVYKGLNKLVAVAHGYADETYRRIYPNKMDV